MQLCPPQPPWPSAVWHIDQDLAATGPRWKKYAPFLLRNFKKNVHFRESQNLKSKQTQMFNNVYMYIYVYIYIYVCISRNVYIYICVCIYIYIYICVLCLNCVCLSALFFPQPSSPRWPHLVYHQHPPLEGDHQSPWYNYDSSVVVDHRCPGQHPWSGSKLGWKSGVSSSKFLSFK